MRPEQETAIKALHFMRGEFPELYDMFNGCVDDPIRFKRVNGYSLDEIKAIHAKNAEQIDAAIAWVKTQL